MRTSSSCPLTILLGPSERPLAGNLSSPDCPKLAESRRSASEKFRRNGGEGPSDSI